MKWVIMAWRILKGPLGDILKVMIKTLKTLATTEIVRIVKFAVDEVAKDPTLLGDDAKRKAALELIEQECIQSGVVIKDWLKNFLLEAVIGLKKLF